MQPDSPEQRGPHLTETTRGFGIENYNCPFCISLNNRHSLN